MHTFPFKLLGDTVTTNVEEWKVFDCMLREPTYCTLASGTEINSWSLRATFTP